MGENIVKCIVELGKVFFPKGKSHIKSGEFGIFVADIIEPIDNCENIYKNIKLKGTCCEIQYGEKYKVSCKHILKISLKGYRHLKSIIERIILWHNQHISK